MLVCIFLEAKPIDHIINILMIKNCTRVLHLSNQERVYKASRNCSHESSKTKGNSMLCLVTSIWNIKSLLSLNLSKARSLSNLQVSYNTSIFSKLSCRPIQYQNQQHVLSIIDQWITKISEVLHWSGSRYRSKLDSVSVVSDLWQRCKVIYEAVAKGILRVVS